MHCCALYPLGHARSQPQAGFTNTVILIPQAMLDPSSNRISAPCVPSPSGPAGPKLHVGWPDPCSAEIPALWAVGPRFSLDPCSIVSPAPQVPHTSSPVGPQLHVEWLDPCPARIPTTWALLNPHPAGIPTPWVWTPTEHEKLHPPANWDTCPSGLAWPQLYRLTRLQLRLPLEGSKHA
jgi:hypothetical protein